MTFGTDEIELWPFGAPGQQTAGGGNRLDIGEVTWHSSVMKTIDDLARGLIALPPDQPLRGKCMKHHALYALLGMALFTAPSSSGREIDLEKPSSKLRRFASDVIFMVEAGDREKISKRLPQSIIVQFHGQPGQIAIAERQLNELCKVTGVERVEAATPGQTTAKIDLHFGPKADLVSVAKEMDHQITVDRGFSYWTWWDDKNVIDQAAIFIATDKLSGPALEDRLLEQFFGIFGLPGRSKEFDESCVSLKEQVFTSLQPLDKAMLAFYYRAVPAGSRPRDVDTIFREKWAEKP